MAAFKVNINILQGETFTRVDTWKAGAPNYTPVDLTGCTARMQIRTAVESAEVVLELSTDNGRITLGGAAGTITMRLTAAETAALPPRLQAVYDLEIVHSNGDVRRLMAGKVSVSPEVTRG